MKRTSNVLLDVLYPHERQTRLLLSILSRGGTFNYRERTCSISYLDSTGHPLHLDYSVHENLLEASRH